jgi:tripartite-type tricarboxylate transporter receptor subunit TctC
MPTPAQAKAIGKRKGSEMSCSSVSPPRFGTGSKGDERALFSIFAGPRWNSVGLVLAALLVAPSVAPAQTDPAHYPGQTVRIVVPVSPGSIADGFARLIGEKLAEFWKQQVIVDNRPGVPGITAVAKSAPDGYTLLLNSNGHTIAGAINKNIQFDPVRDFAGVTRIASVPLVMITPPDYPARTVKDFVALAKEKPGQLNFASAGVSTTSYLSAEVFKQIARVDIVHIPYRGAPEAVNSVMRGDAQMYFAPIPAAQELSLAGKIGVVAINSSSRVAQLPDVPTIAESGLPSYKYDSWFGMLLPAGTPRPIVEKLSRDIARAMQIAEVRERMVRQGALPITDSPEQFDDIIRNDTERNARILRDAGISPK